MTEKSQQPDFVLRIIVAGTLGAGQDDFIKSISEERLPFASRYTDTDFAHEIYRYVNILPFTFENQSCEVHFIEPPGSRRFDFMWEVIASPPMHLAIIIVVDSTFTNVFRWAKSILETFRAYVPDDIPIIIAANRSDEWGAWDAEALSIALGVYKEIPIIPCVATDRQSVASVLIALCEEILKNIDHA